MTDTRPLGQDGAEAAEGAPAPAQRLRRSRRHKVISGVCEGLGRYFDLDPVIFRIVLGVLAVIGGLGLVAYGFAWLLIPMEGEDENEGRRLLSGRVEGGALTALLFTVVGCGVFLSMLGRTNMQIFAAMLILCLGGAAYWSRHRREAVSGEAPVDEATAHAVADAPPETTPPPVPQSPSWWRDPLTKDGVVHGYLWGPDDGPYDEEEAEAEAARARPVREPAGIGGWTFLAAIGAGTAAGALTWDAEPLGSSLALGLACALGVFGLGFVVSARYGRTGGGTAFWALLTTVLLAGALWLPENITADWTEARWQPAAAAELRPRYELGSGDGKLDLSGLGLKREQTVRTAAEVGLGKLDVTVPRDARFEVHAQVDVGELRLPGERHGEDIDVVTGQERTRVFEPPGGEEAKGTVVLDLKVSVGQLEVHRAAP